MNIVIKNTKYSLIGFTLRNCNHFILKLFDGENFKIINNLNSIVVNIKEWKICSIFYEINNN